MTVSNPTSVLAKILNGLIAFPVQGLANLKLLDLSYSGNPNTIPVFTELKYNGSAYGAVPANGGQIFGIEDFSFSAVGGGLTVAQIGYADDTAGTNFVVIADYFAIKGNTAATISNLIASKLVPTGKHVLLKTNNAGSGTLTGHISCFILEAVT